MLRNMALASIVGLGLAGGVAPDAKAETTPYIGDIMMVGFDYCPRDWTQMSGQILSIDSHEALFAVIGSTYGGDGTTTFALPDMRGRGPVHVGQAGSDLAERAQGDRYGQATASLSEFNLPDHSHEALTAAASNLRATSELADTESTLGTRLAARDQSAAYSATGVPDVPMKLDSVQTSVLTTLSDVGGGAPINIRQASLGVTYCIALYGAFPPRN